jgi:hypothetical protein
MAVDLEPREGGVRAQHLVILNLHGFRTDSQTYGIWSWFMEEPLEQTASLGALPK